MNMKSTKPDSLLNAVVMIAAATCTPVNETLNLYKALQHADNLPKSAGRRVVPATAQYVALVLMALLAGPATANYLRLPQRNSDPAGKAAAIAALGLDPIPEPECALSEFARWLSSSKAARPLVSVTFEADTGRIIAHYNGWEDIFVIRWAEENEDDFAPPPAIRTTRTMDGALFRQLAARLTLAPELEEAA